MKFYYHPTSSVSRRVLIALLEKNLTFERIIVNLNSEQLVQEAINPWSQIPVLVDDGLTIFESMAILEYLEAKYPNPVLLPKMDAESLAIARMVAMVVDNKLYAANAPQWRKILKLKVNDETIKESQKQIAKILNFLESKISGYPYFFSEHLTLADLVAGTTVPSLPLLGTSLDDYPRLKSWSEALNQRESWKKTILTTEIIEQFKPELKAFCNRRYHP